MSFVCPACRLSDGNGTLWENVPGNWFGNWMTVTRWLLGLWSILTREPSWNTTPIRDSLRMWSLDAIDRRFTKARKEVRIIKFWWTKNTNYKSGFPICQWRHWQLKWKSNCLKSRQTNSFKPSQPNQFPSQQTSPQNINPLTSMPSFHKSIQLMSLPNLIYTTPLKPTLWSIPIPHGHNLWNTFNSLLIVMFIMSSHKVLLGPGKTIPLSRLLIYSFPRIILIWKTMGSICSLDKLNWSK